MKNLLLTILFLLYAVCGFAYENNSTLAVNSGENMRMLGFAASLNTQGLTYREQDKIEFEGMVLYPVVEKTGGEIVRGVAVIEEGIQRYEVVSDYNALYNELKSKTARLKGVPDALNERNYLFYVLILYVEYPEVIKELFGKGKDFWLGFSNKTTGQLNCAILLSQVIKNRLAAISSDTSAAEIGKFFGSIQPLSSIIYFLDREVFWSMFMDIVSLDSTSFGPNSTTKEFRENVKIRFMDNSLQAMFFDILKASFQKQGISSDALFRNIQIVLMNQSKFFNVIENPGEERAFVKGAQEITAFNLARTVYKKAILDRNLAALTEEERAVLDRVAPSVMFSAIVPLGVPAASVTEIYDLFLFPLKSGLAESLVAPDGAPATVFIKRMLATFDARLQGVQAGSGKVFSSEEVDMLRGFQTYRVEIVENMNALLKIDSKNKVIRINSKIALEEYNNIVLMLIVYEGLKAISAEKALLLRQPIEEYILLLKKSLALYKDSGNDIKALVVQFKRLQAQNFTGEIFDIVGIDKEKFRFNFVTVLESYEEAPRLFEDIARMYARYAWQA